jgi:chemotaxis protein methyltransferase CheR
VEAIEAERADKEASPPVPGGEFAFAWSDFRKIAALVHAEAGIVLSESKVNLVYSRLAKRLRAMGLKSFREYCALVGSDAGIEERRTMIAAMTTNVTRFFREPHHFDFLRDKLLPGLVAKARAGERVRLWSAGCSSGEEPYSIALTILGAMPDAPNADLVILASDIDHTIVERARAGIYGGKQAETIPDALRRDWLEPLDDIAGPSVRVADPARALVRFNTLNLLEPWPMRGKFDAIFCRNTMIYFDEATQNGIWPRFADAMVPGGTLFIGHSERISVDHQPFDLVAQTTYRLRGGPRR